jgi:hypothetical protein
VELMIEYRLKTPVDVSGNKIEVIRLEEPTFGMMKKYGLPADAVDMKKTTEVLSKYLVDCSGLSVSVLDQMKVSDTMNLIEVMTGFFTRTE